MELRPLLISVVLATSNGCAARTFHADEALEIAYVASSPYGAVNRAAKSRWLKKSGSEAP
jgi:hypothetical protein